MLTWDLGTEERTIEACVYPVYSYVHRGIKAFHMMPEPDKKIFWKETPKDIMILISRCINDLFTQKLISQEEFDGWHKKTCEEICEEFNKNNISKWIDWMENGYTHGLAQGILNLTFENMLLMETWDDQLMQIKKYLHVPISKTSLLLEAVSEIFGVKVIDNQGQYNLYALGQSKSSYRWNYDEYIKFQNDIRDVVECPYDWYETWLKNEKGDINNVRVI